MLPVALLFACATGQQAQTPQPTFTATSTPVLLYATELHDLTSSQDWPEDPTPVPPTPTAIPQPSPPPVRAAAVVQPAPVTVDTSSILAIIGSYSWNFEEAVAVARCESGLNSNAYNPSSATGLFQIIGGNPAMFDPATNVAAAWAKYQDGVRRGNRWYHWNQFGSCGHFY